MLCGQSTRILALGTDPTKLIQRAAVRTLHRPGGLTGALSKQCRPKASEVSPFHTPHDDTLQQRLCVTVYACDRSHRHAAAARQTSKRHKLCKAKGTSQVSGMQFRRRGRASLLPVAASGDRHVNSNQVRKSASALQDKAKEPKQRLAHARLWPLLLEPWCLQPYTGSPSLFWQCHLR